MAGTGIADPNEAIAIVTFDVLEDSAFALTAQLKDAGSDIADTDLSTITITLFITRDGTTSPAGTIINSRDGQDAFNANDVAISPTGLLTWDVQPEDTEIINDEIEVCDNVMKNCRETHRALFEWTLTNGKQGKKVIDLVIHNLEEVP